MAGSIALHLHQPWILLIFNFCQPDRGKIGFYCGFNEIFKISEDQCLVLFGFGFGEGALAFILL